MKNVWIINHYAADMKFQKGGRHYWFAKYLRRQGYAPVIFCCNTKHSGEGTFYDNSVLWQEHLAEEIETPFVFVKARPYMGNGAKRIFNMIDFYRNVKKAAKEYAKQNGKPDIILASSVHPLTLVAGIQLAKYFGVKCICEMRDLWPEAIVVYSRRISKESLIAKMFYQGEKWIYKKADALIFTQEGGMDYLKEKGWDKEQGGPIDLDKVFHINNGVDLEMFHEQKETFFWDDVDMDDSDHYKVVYTGAIRRVNNLGCILDAAKEVHNPKVKFIIWGDGDELELLKKRVTDEQINNVIFKGKVNKQYIPSIVSRSDLNIVHWEMSPLVRVGESYNKAFEYFAAGKPVFYTIRPGYSIVEKYHCGRLTDGFTPKEIAKEIEAMADLPENEKAAMCKNAEIAVKEYDFAKLTKRLVEIVEKQ